MDDKYARLAMARTLRAVLTSVLFFGSAVLGTTHAWALCDKPGDPDCVDQLEAFTGTVDFFATGASFAYNSDDDDRPDGVLEFAEVSIPEARIPARAQLVQAYLYFGGSLFMDNDAVEMPDMSVEIKVPGSDVYETVNSDEVYQSGAIPGFPEVILYNARADITDVIRGAGGQMFGNYEVRGFDADIFYDLASDPEHTAANASFSIILIYEEPRLSPRTIVLFDGLQEVLGSTVTLSLGGFLVSPVPSGTLTIYAQEGDCNPGPDQCENGNNLAGPERVRVIGGDPSRAIILSDAVNPPNDIFNRTINTVDPPKRDEPGTDIDTFDITDALRPGDEEVTVEITTPFAQRGEAGELIGLAYVIVGIDVFLPELRVDSRIEIENENGADLGKFYPGDPLRVSYAVSNTGNLPGTGISLVADMPQNVTDFLVLEEPKGEGVTVTVDKEGGAFGKGQVTVEGLAVRHGEVNDLVLLVETECPLPEGGELKMTADIGAAKEGGQPFSVEKTVPLEARDRCGPRFFLFGGGGCSSVDAPPKRSAPWFILAGLVVAPIVLRRRKKLLLLVLGILAAWALSGCGEDIPTGDLPPPTIFGTPCPGQDGMVVIPSISGRQPYCIDQFEARIEGNAGSADGTGVGSAVSERFVLPARAVTWFQAKAACENAGKALCTADQWVTACRGSKDVTYPYGDTFEPGRCNGYSAKRQDVIETGTMLIPTPTDEGTLLGQGCVTEHGAYDMSGNVWEWNGTEYFEGARRGLVGGGYDANGIGQRCVSEDNHAPPMEENPAYGFRCCAPFGGLSYHCEIKQTRRHPNWGPGVVRLRQSSMIL